MTVVLITSSEIHIKNETLSLFFFFFFFFKVAALEKMKGRVCVWGGVGEETTNGLEIHMQRFHHTQHPPPPGQTTGSGTR